MNEIKSITEANRIGAIYPEQGEIKNKIRNAQFIIDQRGNLGTEVTTTGGFYSVDSCRTVNKTGTGSWTPFLENDGLKIEVTTAITNIDTNKYLVPFYQSMEGYDIYRYNNEYMTLSFLFRSNITGIYSIAFRTFNSARSLVSDFNYITSGEYQYITKTIKLEEDTAPNTTTLGINIVIGSQNTDVFQTSTLDEWQDGNFISSSSNVNWVDTASNYIMIKDIQFEAGEVASPFEITPYQLDLLRCQRYYETGKAHLRFWASTDSELTHELIKMILKRSPPTITMTNGGNRLNIKVGTDIVTDITNFDFRYRIASSAAGDTYIIDDIWEAEVIF